MRRSRNPSGGWGIAIDSRGWGHHCRCRCRLNSPRHGGRTPRGGGCWAGKTWGRTVGVGSHWGKPTRARRWGRVVISLNRQSRGWPCLSSCHGGSRVLPSLNSTSDGICGVDRSSRCSCSWGRSYGPCGGRGSCHRDRAIGIRRIGVGRRHSRRSWTSRPVKRGHCRWVNSRGTSIVRCGRSCGGGGSVGGS